MTLALHAERVAVLAQYVRWLKQAPLDDRQVFQKAILDAQDVLFVTQADIADWFDVSRATVNRWSTGEAAPYPGLRKVLFQRLARRASEAERYLRRKLDSEGVAVAETKNRKSVSKPRKVSDGKHPASLEQARAVVNG